jgi:hypothetical protein
LKTAVSTTALDEFTRAYVQAALWSSTDDDGTPLDSKYSIEDIAPSTLEAMVEDCQQFQQQNAEAIQENGDADGGHDFWLTRNGHGAGFWDGDWPENGKTLTLASKKFGEADLYVGDDGYIYQYGKETPGPVPPREEYNPTPEELAELKSMGIQGSKKTAVYVEEQWEDILQKKGYVEDEFTNVGWEDTLYANPQFDGVQVLVHHGGADAYYLVELNGEPVEQGTDPEVLWNTLEKIPEMYRKSIKHEREFNDKDKKILQEMGVTASKKSKLLDRPQPKLAFNFDPVARQYDYEASGHDVVLISPANTTKLLQEDEARSFWVALDQIENETTEAPQEAYQKRIQDLVRSYFDRDAKAASKKCVIQVDASNLKRGSITFLSGVEYKEDGKVERLKFTSKREKAARFLHSEAMKIKAQLPDFRLGGVLRDA